VGCLSEDDLLDTLDEAMAARLATDVPGAPGHSTVLLQRRSRVLREGVHRVLAVASTPSLAAVSTGSAATPHDRRRRRHPSTSRFCWAIVNTDQR
jgi:hypothetical protein